MYGRSAPSSQVPNICMLPIVLYIFYVPYILDYLPKMYHWVHKNSQEILQFYYFYLFELEFLIMKVSMDTCSAYEEKDSIQNLCPAIFYYIQ